MKARYLSGNQVTLLENGAEYFPALLAAMECAAHEIWIETYIFARDVTGNRIAEALLQAAHRGVDVRVVVDGFGSPRFLEDYGLALRRAGAEVLVYRREVARFSLQRHRLRRMHRKLACIDGTLAFVGGINIIDDFHTPRQVPPRHDFAVRVAGPLLRPIRKAMLRLQNVLRWASLGRRLPFPRPPLKVAHARSGSIRAAFLIRDNLLHRHDIEDAYLAAFATAKREILLANAYFLPGMRFRQALVDAARRGVEVTIVLQGNAEYALLHYATQALYRHFLDQGIRILEYQRSFLHAKVATVDRNWATVGSSNIDPFSLMLAREANVIVRDREFTQELRGRILHLIEEGGVEIRAEVWRAAPWFERTLHWLAYGLVRLLLNLAGYGARYERS